MTNKEKRERIERRLTIWDRLDLKKPKDAMLEIQRYSLNKEDQIWLLESLVIEVTKKG